MLHCVSGSAWLRDEMKIDVPLFATELADVPAEARTIESLGYDGIYTFEGPHDPFFPLLLAAEATHRLDLATAVAMFCHTQPQRSHPEEWANVIAGIRAVCR